MEKVFSDKSQSQGEPTLGEVAVNKDESVNATIQIKEEPPAVQPIGQTQCKQVLRTKPLEEGGDDVRINTNIDLTGTDKLADGLTKGLTEGFAEGLPEGLAEVLFVQDYSMPNKERDITLINDPSKGIKKKLQTFHKVPHPSCTLLRPIKKTSDREISTHHMSQSRDPREDYQNQLRLKHMEECIEEPEMDISSFSTFHTYQWRPGELLDSSREEELVTNNALIQKEPPDPTPLPFVMMIPNTEHTVNLTQVRNIEKELDLFKDHLESNSCLRIKVKHEHFKNGALIKAEPCLLIYCDFMTMITHLLFAKGVDKIACIKEEPLDLKFLSSNLFKRTGIGVVLKPKIDCPFNRTRRKSDNAYELELQGELDLRSNPFQVGEDDVIMESTKDLEFDQERVAEEELEANEQLEPEEHFEAENELITEKEYEKDVILTSLVLIHDHQMDMCLICTWKEIEVAFLNNFYNDARSEELRMKISTFSQEAVEAFKAAWIRFRGY
ncbi:putative athila transposon protein [Arabidopsis thaliana]|uniref:F10A2.7 protein n=1 Tax=Arabidopsis thaliana TaxID=3702 RepID=Q9XH25_ARATH|nr:contains similarity to two Arabidopsis thaliana hypothetical proteins, which have similarity to retrotransposon Athila (GB:AF076275 and X81801) [Arabidopsis thaliana]CAB77929.1 putative athila transposon protein [Arabidopsis thaliana]